MHHWLLSNRWEIFVVVVIEGHIFVGARGRLQFFLFQPVSPSMFWTSRGSHMWVFALQRWPLISLTLFTWRARTVSRQADSDKTIRYGPMANLQSLRVSPFVVCETFLKFQRYWVKELNQSETKWRKKQSPPPYPSTPPIAFNFYRAEGSFSRVPLLVDFHPIRLLSTCGVWCW